MIKAVLYLAGLGAFYALVHYLNQKTPLPEGCEDILESCEGCKATSCGRHPRHQTDKEETNND